MSEWLDGDGSGEMSGVAWAEGFVQGMTLLNEDWALLFESETGQELLYPILLLGLEKEAMTEGLQRRQGHTGTPPGTAGGAGTVGGGGGGAATSRSQWGRSCLARGPAK